MSDYSRWKSTIEKHDREDGICPLLDDVYQQGRADKYLEITSEYMLLTEKQVDDIRADAIDEVYRAWVDWNSGKYDEQYFDDVVDKLKGDKKNE